MKYKIGDEIRLTLSGGRDIERGVIVDTDKCAKESYLVYTVANGWADWFEERKILGYYNPRNPQPNSELSGISGQLKSKYYTADPCNWEVI